MTWGLLAFPGATRPPGVCGGEGSVQGIGHTPYAPALPSVVPETLMTFLLLLEKV